MELRTCKVCNLTSDITKFVIKENKIYGRRCKKCNSIVNNQRLKEKKYYSNYYILNKEVFALRDRERYAKKKLLKNKVIFEFETCTEITPQPTPTPTPTPTPKAESSKNIEI
jgi:hypothetical protein